MVLTIDGASGGGQLLRTALSLAVLTDTPVRIDDVRRARPVPGLRPQHLAAVTLAADCCDAEVTGAELGSETVTFRPGDGRKRSLTASVATAGSVTLLFDTLLPIAAVETEPFRLTASGGTDVKWAPTIAYYRQVKLPLLARVGLQTDVTVHRTGFYPVGGGRATLRTGESSLSALELDARGELRRVDVYSKAAATLAERDVAERQAARACDRLAAVGLPVEERDVEYVESRSPGSAVLLRGVYEASVVGADAVGERGRTSETVADGAVDQFLAVHDSGAPVDVHMADQILVHLALVGGRVRVPRVTPHVRTNVDVLTRFGSDVHVVREDGETATLVASPHPAVRPP